MFLVASAVFVFILPVLLYIVIYYEEMYIVIKNDKWIKETSWK